MTSEEIVKGIQERLTAFPEMRAVAARPDFKATIRDILDFSGLGKEYIDILELHILLLLTFYVPYSEFNELIAENLNVQPETADNITGLIDSLLLSEVSENLIAYEVFTSKKEIPVSEDTEETERATDSYDIPSPQHAPSVEKAAATTPLTRDDIKRALQTQRTMGGDIADMGKTTE